MVAVEAAVVLPAVLLIVGLVFVLGRSALAEQAVGSAASAAARAASIERNTATANTAATEAAVRSLAEAGVDCTDQSIGLDASGLSSPVGVSSMVSVTLSCRVAFDLSLPGFPSSRLVVVTRTSPVDTYRSR